MTVFYLKSGDRLPKLRATLSDSSGVAINLTGGAVQFRMKRSDGTGDLKVNSPATIVTPTSGIVEYAWAAGDVDTPGDYIGEFSITISGLVQTIPSGGYVSVLISPRLE